MSIRAWDVKQFHVVDLVALCPGNWESLFVWAKNLLTVQAHLVGSVAIQPGKVGVHLRCIREAIRVKPYRRNLGKVLSHCRDAHQLVLVELMNIVHGGPEKMGWILWLSASGLKLCNLSNDTANTPSMCGATEDLSKLLTVPCNHSHTSLAGLPGFKDELITVAQPTQPPYAPESSIAASWLCAVTQGT